jgi:hypothetical protein
MKFKCRHCKKIVSRTKAEIALMGTKRGYKSLCKDKGKMTFMIPLNPEKYKRLINDR